MKAAAAWSRGDDIRTTKIWSGYISVKGVQERRQPNFTCETGICISRIARVFSSLHRFFALSGSVECTVLESPHGLSSHRPVSFSHSKSPPQRRNSVPSCVVGMPEYADEVNAQFEYPCRGNPYNAFGRLGPLKSSILDACEELRRRFRNRRAENTEAQLSATFGYLRAAKLGNHDETRELQLVYPKLKLLPCGVDPRLHHACKELMGHVVDLSRTAIAG